MRCCCSSITRGRAGSRSAARTPSSRARPRRCGPPITTGPSCCGSPASTRDLRARERDEQQRIGRLRRLVDDDAVEDRVAEHRVIAADARREHDLGAIDDRALGIVDLARGIAIERARLGPQRADFGARAAMSSRLPLRRRPIACLRIARARSRHSRARSYAPSSSICASTVSDASAGETRAG